MRKPQPGSEEAGHQSFLPRWPLLLGSEQHPELRTPAPGVCDADRRPWQRRAPGAPAQRPLCRPACSPASGLGEVTAAFWGCFCPSPRRRPSLHLPNEDTAPGAHGLSLGPVPWISRCALLISSMFLGAIWSSSTGRKVWGLPVSGLGASDVFFLNVFQLHSSDSFSPIWFLSDPSGCFFHLK